jgi:hypothetical protein
VGGASHTRSEWIYRVWANPGTGKPMGGILPPCAVLALGRRSGRVPALPYPPPRRLECTPEGRPTAIDGHFQTKQIGAKPRGT